MRQNFETPLDRDSNIPSHNTPVTMLLKLSA